MVSITRNNAEKIVKAIENNYTDSVDTTGDGYISYSETTRSLVYNTLEGFSLVMSAPDDDYWNLSTDGKELYISNWVSAIFLKIRG